MSKEIYWVNHLDPYWGDKGVRITYLSLGKDLEYRSKGEIFRCLYRPCSFKMRRDKKIIEVTEMFYLRPADREDLCSMTLAGHKFYPLIEEKTFIPCSMEEVLLRCL